MYRFIILTIVLLTLRASSSPTLLGKNPLDLVPLYVGDQRSIAIFDFDGLILSRPQTQQEASEWKAKIKLAHDIVSTVAKNKNMSVCIISEGIVYNLIDFRDIHGVHIFAENGLIELKQGGLIEKQYLHPRIQSMLETLKTNKKYKFSHNLESQSMGGVLDISYNSGQIDKFKQDITAIAKECGYELRDAGNGRLRLTFKDFSKKNFVSQMLAKNQDKSAFSISDQVIDEGIHEAIKERGSTSSSSANRPQYVTYNVGEVNSIAEHHLSNLEDLYQLVQYTHKLKYGEQRAE